MTRNWFQGGGELTRFLLLFAAARFAAMAAKSGFCQISQLLITLGHMLLHKPYTNVAIVFTLV